MKTVNILAADNAVGSSLVGVIDFIEFANTFWKTLNPTATEKLLDYRIYSSSGNVVPFSNGLKIDALRISEYEAADADFLISAFAHDKKMMGQFLESCGVFKDVLQQAHARQSVIASYCTGTFGLAACGLLDDKRATTVWWLSNHFQSLFPNVKLNLDQLVVTDSNIITGGATTSYFNVCLRLLEQLTNELFSMKLSKLLLLDRHRLSQRAFIDTEMIINKHDALVENVQDWMIKHHIESIPLERVCNEFNVTKRTLIRRFKASCNETPLNYLQKIRVEKAKHFLETTNLPIEQIVSRVGYEDTASFRKLFTSQTQLTPKAYRERFSLLVAETAY